MREKGQIFLIEEFQLINAERMRGNKKITTATP